MVKIHQLWSEPDTSPRGDGAQLAARLEPVVGLEPGTGTGAEVSIDPQTPLVELADKQVIHAIAIHVAVKRGRVADELNVDRLAASLDLNRRGKARGRARARGIA